MNTRLKVLCLKLRISNLNRRRIKALDDICRRHKEVVSKIDKIETLDPVFFEKIDKRIAVLKRLTSSLNEKRKGSVFKNITLIGF